MVLIEVVGFITEDGVEKISCILNTYSTFDVYGSTKRRTVLFQSRDLNFCMTNDVLSTVTNRIVKTVHAKNFEKVVDRSKSERNVVIYIRT